MLSLILASRSIKYRSITFLETIVVERQNTDQDCQLWDAAAFGQRLSLSKRQVFRLNACGKVPRPVRIGGAVRWNSAEVSGWVAAGCPDRQTWEALKASAQA